MNGLALLRATSFPSGSCAPAVAPRPERGHPAPQTVRRLRNAPEEAPNHASGGAQAMLAALRALLREHGIRESRSVDEEGVCLVIDGRAEISMYYHGGEPAVAGSGAVPERRYEAALFACCGKLVRSGYAVTLIASARTLALHVRSDEDAREPSRRRAASRSWV